MSHLKDIESGENNTLVTGGAGKDLGTGPSCRYQPISQVLTAATSTKWLSKRTVPLKDSVADFMDTVMSQCVQWSRKEQLDSLPSGMGIVSKGIPSPWTDFSLYCPTQICVCPPLCTVFVLQHFRQHWLGYILCVLLNPLLLLAPGSNLDPIAANLPHAAAAALAFPMTATLRPTTLRPTSNQHGTRER